MKRILRISLCLAFILAAHPAGAAAPAPDVRIVNTAGDFLTFMGHARARPAAERLFLWYRDYYRPNEALLFPILFRNGSREVALRRIEAELSTIFRGYDRYFRLYERFRRDGASTVARMVDRFRSRYPEYRPDENGFLILCGCPFFNGKADQVGRDQYLLISADTFFRTRPLEITLQHEMFHLFHMKMFLAAGNAPVERLYFPLLFEGCAVNHSLAMFPGSPLRDHLMVKDPRYRERCERILPKILPALKARLDVAGVDDWYDALFKVDGGKAMGFEDRAGYYVGLEVARRIARKAPPDRIVRFTSAEMIAAARDALDGMMADRGIR